MKATLFLRRSLVVAAAVAISVPLAGYGAQPAFADANSPSLTAAFTANEISVNATTTLTFTLTNNDGGGAATVNAAFTVALPAGLVVATPNRQTNDCGGTISDFAGSSAVGISGATISAGVGSTCSFTVAVTGTTLGAKTATTTPLTSDHAVGNAATATVTVARGCQSYADAAFVGAVVLNSDGTPIGCGLDNDAVGAPMDLTPAGWPTTAAGFTTTLDAQGHPTARDALYSSRLGYACDDCSVGAAGPVGALQDATGPGLPIGFPINFYGTTYNDVWVNSNGSISFGGGSQAYAVQLSDVLAGRPGAVGYPGVVPFAVDLANYTLLAAATPWDDATRHTDFFYWGRTTYDGHEAFVATWMNVLAYGDSGHDLTSQHVTFQVMLVNVDDNSENNVDIIINYDAMGNLDSKPVGYGDNRHQVAAGLGTADPATGAVSYASLVDDADPSIVYDGRTSGDLADTGLHPLSKATLNSTTPGQFKFEMRGGVVPQTATVPGAAADQAATMTDTSAAITWSPPANTGGSPITSYTVQHRIAESTQSWAAHSVTDSPYTLSGLTAGATYEYQIAAVNGVGQGPWSSIGTFPSATSRGSTPVATPPKRIAGDDRFGTATTISAMGYPNAQTAGAVVLARSDDYPDALVGAPLAAQKNGPLLFTDAGGSLPDATLAEIHRVLPAGSTVYLLGGETAIPNSVATALAAAGYVVVRYAGADRFATAVQVAHALGDPSTVLLATGQNHADALVAGPAAATIDGAVLLTDGARLPAATSEYLKAHPGTVYAIGGPAVAADPAAIPVTGADRYATATATAARFFTAPTSVGIASGTDYTDAIAAGAYLAHTGGPLILSDRASLPGCTSAYLAEARNSLMTSNIFGGTAALSTEVHTAIGAALGY